MNTTLKDQGFRFLVSNDRKECDWVHPAEIAAYQARISSTDCTDMDDAEFDVFMGVHEAVTYGGTFI